MFINNKSKFLFFIWFGIGAPIFFGTALYLSFQFHMICGIATTCVYLFRVWDSFETTCSRCSNYGSWNCGLPGKSVKWFFNRNFQKLSPNRIKRHRSLDWIVTIYTLCFYIFSSAWGILSIIWPIGAYFIVYRPRRYHGLLNQLKPLENI